MWLSGARAPRPVVFLLKKVGFNERGVNNNSKKILTSELFYFLFVRAESHAQIFANFATEKTRTRVPLTSTVRSPHHLVLTKNVRPDSPA